MSLDSLLDTMTTVVGILIILLIVLQVGADRAVQEMVEKIKEDNASLNIICIIVTTPGTRTNFHHHAMTALNELIRSGRQKADSMLISLNFAWYSNNHVEMIWVY